MKVVIAGDFVPRNRVESAIQNRDFSSLFSDIKSVIAESDYSLINLECPVVKDGEPLIKCGPNLKTREAAIDALKFMGFDAVTLANNHFYDYGEEGVCTTLNVLAEHKIDKVGGGRNYNEASQTLYKKIKGSKFAFINCCEREFSIARENSGGSNPLDPIDQYKAITEAKSNSDFVVVVVHGGLEGCPFPSPRMQKTYRFFIEVGANAVINHHQHCYSGYEIYKGCPIVYGLGNFSFDGAFSKVNSSWNLGYMVQLEFDLPTKSPKLSIIPYVQGSDEAGTLLLTGNEKTEILSDIEKLSKIISEPHDLERSYNKYVDEHSVWYKIAFEPWGKGLRNIRRKGWLPSLVSKEKWLALADYTMCETHLDVIHRLFENIVSQIRNK